MTEITSSINSRVRLWKRNHSDPGCSFYNFTSGILSSKTLMSIYIYIKTPFNPYPDWGPNESERDNNPHMVSILSLYVHDSCIATVSCRLQEDIQLEAHFLVGVQIDPSKKKQNKTKTNKYCREALGR